MDMPEITMTTATAIEAASPMGPTASDTDTRSSSAEDKSRPCHLLALAAELRNYIWTLSFSPDNSASIDLAEAKVPGAALLATSKQIRAEAVGLFAVAKVDYWRLGRFHLRFEIQNATSRVPLEDESVDMDFMIIRADKLSLVTHITFEDDNVRLTYKKGLWTCKCTSEPPPRWYRSAHVPHLAMRFKDFYATEGSAFDVYRRDHSIDRSPPDIEDWMGERWAVRKNTYVELAAELSEEDLSSAKLQGGWVELSKAEIRDVLLYVRNIAN
jgi:hypothetical protein